VPGEQCLWRHRENVAPVGAGYQPGQRGEPHPISRLVTHPVDVPAQHRVLVPEDQQLSIPSPVPAEHQDSEAKGFGRPEPP
jgi:hypothetical protein